MDARELSERLAKDAEGVASYLLPHGKRKGHEWCTGSIHGEQGDSLKVRLTGNDCGIWKDFASGEKGGDLLDLWCQARGVSLKEAIQQAKDYLGIREPQFMPLPKKQFTRPEKPRCEKPGGDVLQYLVNERKISIQTLDAFKIAAENRWIVFPYLRDGELMLWKKISLDRDNGKKRVMASKGSGPILFGWQALDPNARTIILTEGEIDAMTLHQYGFNALSVPFGGGAGSKQQWVESEYANLERFSEIYLCLDADEQGQAAAEELVRRLGAHRCKVVDLGFKDANEALLAGMTREYIQACLEEARTVGPEELKNAADFRESVEKFLASQEKKENLLTLPWAKTHAEIQLEFGQLSVWSGFNGSGKSEILLQSVIHTMTKGNRVCIASLEVPPVKLIGKHLLRQITGMVEPSPEYREAVYQWLSDRLWLFNLVGTAKRERLLEVFEYAVKRFGVNVFVIDSLMKCSVDETDYDGQKRFVEALCDFRTQYPVHIHLVAHSRKGRDESAAPGKMDVKGSGAITDLCDNAFSVWRNKPKEEALKGVTDPEEEVKYNEKKLKASEVMRFPDAKLSCLKQREEGLEPTINLWFDRGSRQFLETQQSQPTRYLSFSNYDVTRQSQTGAKQ